MRFDVLTLHPDMVRGPLGASILGRATERGAIQVEVGDMREHGIGRHRTVDDTPYGGGAGMVLRVDVVVGAIEAARGEHGHVVLLSPQGQRFTQAHAQRLATREHLVFVCGHYEGFDARVEAHVDEMLSIGDFVVTGGEVAAVAMVDAVARLVPGVLGNDQSALDESFADGLLEYPQYTRPRVFRDQEVPEVLLSGHHERIDGWRREQAEARTRRRRPDLWAARAIDVDVPEE
ncbi:MAG: tRNA (guanosine(37)-N1)-methyltransferase TrmD [Myxococcales bacterium]|nr:tRNA (guanosine(37)-N1)-methyltransferase TrmD [Myxococcales bacterium]